MTIPQISNPPSTNWAVQLNEIISSAGQALLFARKMTLDSGFALGFVGLDIDGTTVADSTVTCANGTRYIIAHRTTYVLSAEATSTNYDAGTTYGKVGIAVFASGALTSYTDARLEPKGILDHSAGAGFGDALVANPLSQFAATTSAQLAGVLSDETGSGAAVFATSPTLVTPALGTPSALVLTNATGLPGAALTGAYTAAGLTMATARLLGRTTASTGAAEEITVGSGLTLNAGSLTATGTGGTVTATAGSLTSDAVVLGAGTTDTKVVAGITTDGASAVNLGVAGSSVGKVVYRNATSGSITMQPVTGALGAVTLSLPATTGTLALTSDLSSGYQPLDADLTTIAGLTATTDNFMQAKSGAWASRTPAQVVADLQGDGLTVDYAGFRGIPQNSQSAAYTLVAADAGKHIYHPSGDANARTFTIPANGSVAFPVGTSVTFINETSQVVSIAITTDTLVLAGTGSTGTRSLAQYGVATAVKVTSTRWYISGNGVT